MEERNRRKEDEEAKREKNVGGKEDKDGKIRG